MSDQIELKERGKSTQISSAEGVGADGCQLQRKGGLSGWLPMSICCGAPLLLVAVISLFGFSLGAVLSGLLSLVAVLACPLGMYLMMRMMTKQK